MTILRVSLLFAIGCSGNAAVPPDGSAPDADPCATTVVARPGTVLTSTGPVTGSTDGAVWAWKGIPYAAPPIGDLRWRPPATAACWTDERVTTAFGAQCPQLDSNGQVVGVEDCLTLNVWAPATATAAPVLVFIHGGGNTQGTASGAVYDGAALATQTGAVIVTFDYRLGALGFFAHPGLDAESAAHVSGNYGILDQIAALRWVQTNIAGFGGNAARVLLFGESAGGQDTLVHIASPLSAGLFAAAISESGGAYRATLAQAETTMQAVVTAAGCTTATDIPACMRAAPAGTLAAIPSAVGPLDTGFHYTPNIDGYVLTDTAPNVIAAGHHNAVPFALGTNRDETSRMVPQVATDTAYQAAVHTLYPSIANALLAEYPSTDYPTPQRALIRLTTDATWTCPTRRLARAAADHQTAPVYRYYFTWAAPGATGAAVGATHGLELPFVFRTFSAVNFTPQVTDVALSNAIDAYWGGLATTGTLDGIGPVAWPRYDSATDPYLQLDATITAGAGLATAHCDAIDALLP